MSPRAALLVLAMGRVEGESREQHELDRITAVEVLAEALGFREEAIVAHAVAESLKVKDEQQLQLFKLLEADRG